ncbi:hypothetical protein HDU96_006110 [Phlyctochytrium bullatum]|nr:hypothetical protein HDU96_006110 [Phlyctochytrium bullatum]
MSLALAVALSLELTQAVATPYRDPYPSEDIQGEEVTRGGSNLSLQLVTIIGSARTYKECSFLRDATNVQCTAKVKPWNPPDGPTSGECITESAAYGDVCIQAVDNSTLPFDYVFHYVPATAARCPRRARRCCRRRRKRDGRVRC